MPYEQIEVVSKGLAHCNESFLAAGGCLAGFGTLYAFNGRSSIERVQQHSCDPGEP